MKLGETDGKEVGCLVGDPDGFLDGGGDGKKVGTVDGSNEGYNKQGMNVH